MSSKSYIYPFGILLALLLVVVPFACHGFVVDRFSTTLSQTKTRRYTLLLFAKKATAKKRKKTSGNNNNNASGGGFGAGAVSTSASSKKSENTAEDYAVFPALEPSVKETLVRAEGAMDMILTDDNNEATSGELRNEIYQRLDQIYGFEHFNYEEHPDQRNQEAEAEPMSLQDLMSGSASLLEKDDDDSDNSSSSEATSLPISKLPPFEKIQVLHVDPLVLQIDDFFAPEECDAYIQMTTEGKQDIYKTGSLTVGKDEQSQAQRTSTTWFNHYKNVPALMAKASRLLGLDGIDQWEEPQTVRYRKSEKFTWHLDALGPQELTNCAGGQRTATLLVYHTDVDESDGGATVFRDLKDPNGDRLKMRPKKGSALLFFPSAGGIPDTPLDIRTLHCGEAVSKASSNEKWISQMWLRQKANTYVPTAPKGNTHAAATEAISEYCEENRS